MDLTVARFDLDDRVRPRNTRRATPRNAPLPTDFPFLADFETGAVLEPVLLFLANKFSAPDCFVEGRWTRRNSADAAANDLRDWFTFLSAKSRDWDDVTSRFLAVYLKSLKMDVSDATDDFLAASTVLRRCASIDEFHRYAQDRWPLGKFADTRSARRLAGIGRRYRAHRSDENARPLAREHVDLVADWLGPLPDDRTPDGKPTRSRLAFEIALNVGLRIDEVLKLRADDITHLDASGRDNVMLDLEITRTKGLVPRTVYFPTWLVRDLQTYIAEERQHSVDAGARSLAAAGVKPPPNLFLNHHDARGNAGKELQAGTLQEEFANALTELKFTRRRRKAIGTPSERVELTPRHVFHDARHTYAYWTYLAQVDQGNKEPWLFIRDRLGHSLLQTTVDTYLSVFNELGAETLEQLAASFTAIRRGISQ